MSQPQGSRYGGCVQTDRAVPATDVVKEVGLLPGAGICDGTSLASSRLG
jgi:hypothetical protein